MVAVLAQTDGGQTFDLGVSIIVFFAAIGLFTLMVASVWRVFTDMGDPGWVGLVPFLRDYRVLQRSRPNHAAILTVSAIFCGIGSIVASWDIAKLFGKSPWFGLGLVFLPFIFMPMLAFGDSQYQGPQIAAL